MNITCSLRRLLLGHIDHQHAEDIVDLNVTGLTLDSRSVSNGMLFVALQGTQTHGIIFAKKAEALGAGAVIWEFVEGLELPKLDIPLIEVKNLSQKLGAIADRYYGSPSRDLNVIGITGTDGKTSVSHFLAQSINAGAIDSCAVIGTLGIGLPNNLQKATHTTPDVITVHSLLKELHDSGVKALAMEVSSHALDQGRVNAVQFDTAVLTNLTRDHLDYHGTIEAYAAAKEKLFHWKSLKTVVVNLDDAMGLRLAKELAGHPVRVIAYGLTNSINLPDGVEKILSINATFDHKGINAEIVTPLGSGKLKASILGRFNLSNLLAVLGVLIAAGYDLDVALEQIQAVKTVPGRMERVGTASHAANGLASSLVVVDYAHTPGALKQALLAVREHTKNRLICVFGCGGDRDTGKRPLMAENAEILADHVIVTDDNPRTESASDIFTDIKKGFKQPNKIIFEHDRKQAIALAINESQAGDIVLIAGKGHETVQMINGDNFPFDDRIEAAKIIANKRVKEKAA